MTTVSKENKDRLIAAIGDVEASIKSFGAAYRDLLAAYDAARTEAFQQGGVHRGSNFASSIGPDRFNEAIVGSMLAHGLDPLLRRTSMRSDSRPTENLVEELGHRLAGA